MKLLYLANARLPTEKAHGAQIMRMCAAFAAAGAEVALWHARRKNTPALAGRDPFDHYEIARSFAMRAVPCLDLFSLAIRLGNRWGSDPAAYLLQTATYLLALRARLARARFDALYTRDAPTLLALALTGLGPRAFYEAHTFPHTPAGRWLRQAGTRRAAGIVAITQHLGERYTGAFGIPPTRNHTAHDAVDPARFLPTADKREARRALGLPPDAFIAGYVGRFHTMGMSKGLDTLAEAAARAGEDVHVCLVGGPTSAVDALRESAPLPAARLHYLGHVLPGEVPRCLAALDVCTMPFPWNEHFAYYASPIKLFEYMASGRPIVASDLPATREVVAHEESALLAPPGDAGALAAALRRLADVPALGARLAEHARVLVEARYTWSARAEGILAFIKRRIAI